MAKTTAQLIEDEKRRLADTQIRLRKRIAVLQQRQQTEDRKRETRRNIIAGRMLRAAGDEDAAAGLRAGDTIRDWMTRRLDETLTRNDERKLFGLEPLAQPAETPGPEMADADERETDTDGRTPGTARISSGGDDGIRVETPSWNADFGTGFREMGGRWSKSRQLWIGAPEHRLADVVTLARRCFGNVEHGNIDAAATDPAKPEFGGLPNLTGAAAKPEDDAKLTF